MLYRVFDAAELPALVSAFMDGYEVVAPVKRGAHYSFEAISSPDEMDLAYDTTLASPKRYFLPPTETLMRYNAVTNEVAELDADKKVAEIGRFYAQHQLISISWQENELFVVSCNCTFREFVKEPLKLQLRNSAVAFLSLRDCVERERLALRGVRRVLDLDGEGVQSLPGKPVYVVPP